MTCRDQPVTCRGKIADRYGLTPNKLKSWQYEGNCPKCGHGGFSITAGDQGYNPYRNIWHCNCHRCRCDKAEVRAAMLADGIDEDCLGSYGRTKTPRPPADPAAALRAAMLAVLADPKIRALADLKLRMLEVIESEPAPTDWPGFVAFAERAGVQRSKRYDAAYRWGRSATASRTESEEQLSSGCRSDGKSAVPFRETGHTGHLSDEGRPEDRGGRFTRNAGIPKTGRPSGKSRPVSGQRTNGTNRTGGVVREGRLW